MDIFELAKAKKMFGGGKREGTAVKAGEVVERIYFNTKLTAEETNAILSQLTFVNGFYTAYVCANMATMKGHLISVSRRDNGYIITYQDDLAGTNVHVLFNIPYYTEQTNGWDGEIDPIYDGFSVCRVSRYIDLTITDSMQPLTEGMGMTVGAENEKIKNVLSITPF